MLKKELFFLISAILISLSGYCQTDKPTTPIRFSSISIQEGLSQSTVYSITQDNKGNLWIATADGLNKYDGYNFNVFRHEHNNPNSIQSDLIRSLYFDNDNQLWIGTELGLALYDSKKNKFHPYPINSQVNHIAQLSDSILYLATNNALYSFNKETKQYTNIYQDEKLDITFNKIVKHRDLLLIGSNKGLYMSISSKIELVPFNDDLSNKLIMDICPDHKGIWIATEGDGLYYISADGSTTNYRHNKNDRSSIASDFVRTLCFDDMQRLWIGTFGGLSIYNQQNNNFSCYYSNIIEEGSINQNSVRSLYLDKQGAMWIGSFYGGLNYFHPLRNQFEKIHHIPYANSLNDNVVSCIVEGQNGELWIGTNDNGLNLYNPKTKRFTYYTSTFGTNSILSNNIKTVLVEDNHVYIGSHSGGLARLNRNTNTIKNYTPSNSHIGDYHVYALAKDIQNKIWIGTLSGLMIYNPTSETFSTFDSLNPIADENHLKTIKQKQIFCLLLDSKQQMWIGTENGIFVYSFITRSLKEYDIASEEQTNKDKIYCIFEDKQKRIWIGKHTGLSLFHEESSTFSTITTLDGLPNNNIYGILQDSFNRLWLSSNRGLTCYNPDDGSIRTYGIIDGLQSEQFNRYAYCKTSWGEMYFGGINGVTTFYPEQLTDNPFTPPVILTQFNLFNHSVTPNDNTDILTEDISETRSIKLKPNQTSFSIVFSVPNYLSAQHNTFAYMLKGLDDDWTFTSSNRSASYANLKPGEYTFMVKAGNSDGKWNNEPTSLHITIAPYWWQTTWAQILFILLICGILFWFFKFLYNKQLLKNQLALERIEKDKMEEVNQMKLRFFINLSHEFRTPLTLIISPLQEILNMTHSKQIQNQVKIVQRNANKLLYLVNQLMDYRRAELGVFELKVSEQNPKSQVEDLMSLFERLTKMNNIDFIFENDIEDRNMLYDSHYLDLILSNLLSNAFKYTPTKGCITIHLYSENSEFAISVKDTGEGISNKYKDIIFERFYQINTDNIGTGIGLSLVKRLVDLHHGRITLESELGKGSNFTIYLPQDKSLYTSEELSIQNTDLPHRAVFNENVDLVKLLKDKEESEILPTAINEDKPTILIVEDDPDVRSYLIKNFEPLANILAAEDGKIALDIMKEHDDIDLVITDIMLPHVDGITLCKTIKQNIRTSHILVIMLTAKTNQSDQLEGLSVGADDYVYKPFNISILKMKVLNMIKARLRTLEHYSNNLEVDPQKITFNEMDKEFLEKAKSVVEENMDNIEFSVDSFCKEMAMSRSNLHLKMKAITGESTIEFIKKIKFNEACKLLEDGRYSIAEISTMIGYNTPSYFTSSFKKYFGILPTDYIKDLQKKD